MGNLAPLLSSESDDWNTPSSFLCIVHKVAPLALDPFPSLWTPEQPDGFDTSWKPCLPGMLTFCNWPYSRNADFAGAWSAEHPRKGDDWHLVGLGPCRPDTQWFTTMREHSRAICFLHGRLKFERANGLPATTAPFPSCVWYAGPAPGRFLDVFSEHGWVVML